MRDAETNKVTGTWEVGAHLRSSGTSPRTRSTRSQRARVIADPLVDSDTGDDDEIGAGDDADDADGASEIEGFRLVHMGKLLAFLDDNFCSRRYAHDQLDHFVAFISKTNQRRGAAAQNDLRQFRQTEQRTANTTATKEAREGFASTITSCCDGEH